MTTVAATTSSGSRGLHATANRDECAGSPRQRLQRLQRLQKLPAVPGYVPSRVNDLLLLRPDTDSQISSEPKEERNNRHVVFFHGDIQVSGTRDANTADMGGVSNGPGGPQKDDDRTNSMVLNTFK